MANGHITATSISTLITEEICNTETPYITHTQRISGYNTLELCQKASFSEALYLLFIGELPSAEHAQLLNSLQIALCNPGPRHPAARAAMTAGVSKTRSEHLLPTALLVLGGGRGGSQEVIASFEWFHRTLKQSGKTERDLLLENEVPGFGLVYGGRDALMDSFLSVLSKMKGAGPALSLCLKLQSQRYPIGILDTGLCAAACFDLGFGARESGGLFQLFRAPGLLAHGMEKSHSPISSAPLLEDDAYELENEKH